MMSTVARGLSTCILATILASPDAGAQPGPYVEDTASVFRAAPGYWLGGFWADVDADGDPDLLLTEADQNDRLFWNLGGGLYDVQTLTVNPHREVNGGGWADFDRDGRLDFVAASIGGSAMLVNTGNPDEPFIHVPLAFDGDRNRDIVPGDYDLDGDPDIAAVAWGSGLNLLYRNAGFGFALGQSLSEDVDGTTACWGDYDDDGWPDVVLVAASGDHSQLFRNHEGVFEPVVNSAISLVPGNAQGCGWGDYDGDGDLDLFLARAGVPGGPDQADLLFRNNGGEFELVPAVLPFDTTRTFGSAWGDVDHDGDLDLVVVARDEPDVLYLNDGSGGFLGQRFGRATDGWSISASLIDHDADGDLDLLTTHGCYAAQGRNRFYTNTTDQNRNWMQVELRGVDSDRLGLGARLWAHASIGGVSRVIRRDMEVRSGRMAQAAYRLHFGLGDADRVDSLVVAWPSGRRQVVLDVPVNGVHTVAEELGVATGDPPTERGRHSVSVSPNPAGAFFRVTIMGFEDGPVQVELIDVLGRRVGVLSGVTRAGTAVIAATRDIVSAAGRYQVRVIGYPQLSASVVLL